MKKKNIDNLTSTDGDFENLDFHYTNSIDGILSEPSSLYTKIASGTSLIVFLLFIAFSNLIKYPNSINVPSVVTGRAITSYIIANESGILVKKKSKIDGMVQTGDTIAIIEGDSIVPVIAKRTGILQTIPDWDFKRSVFNKDTLAAIWDDKSKTTLIQIKVDASAAAEITPGNPLKVTLNYYPKSKFGYIETQVKSISSFGNTKNIFTITAEKEYPLLTSEGKTLFLLGNYYGEAEITIKEETLFEKILSSLYNKFK